MKKIGLNLTIAFLLANLAYSASAHNNDLNSQFSQLSTQLTNQLKLQLKAQTELMSDPEIISAIANQQFVYYKALIKAGFSEEQAFQIVLAKANTEKS